MENIAFNWHSNAIINKYKISQTPRVRTNFKHNALKPHLPGYDGTRPLPSEIPDKLNFMGKRLQNAEGVVN